MFKKIIKKFKKRTSREEKICWPCDWNFEDVEMFNAMLMGMALEKTG